MVSINVVKPANSEKIEQFLSIMWKNRFLMDPNHANFKGCFGYESNFQKFWSLCSHDPLILDWWPLDHIQTTCQQQRLRNRQKQRQTKHKNREIVPRYTNTWITVGCAITPMLYGIFDKTHIIIICWLLLQHLNNLFFELFETQSKNKGTNNN